MERHGGMTGGAAGLLAVPGVACIQMIAEPVQRVG